VLNKQITHSFSTAGGARIALGKISEIVRSCPLLPEDHPAKAMTTQRQAQLRASDYLLTHVLDINDAIERNEKGVPALVNGRANVSISHTHDYIALMTHPTHRVGVDIELVTRDISHILPRFTTPEELQLAKGASTLPEAVFIWSCKECLFKAMQQEAVHFKEQLRLLSIEPGEVVRSRWEVNHPGLEAVFRVNSTIFDVLLVSFIDEPCS